MLPLDVDLEFLASEVRAMRAWDGYVASGTSGGGGFEAVMEMVGEWEDVVGGWLERGYRREGEEGDGVRVEVGSLLREHVRKYFQGSEETEAELAAEGTSG